MEKVRVLFGGDCTLQTRGINDSPFKFLEELFNEFDLIIFNLETVILRDTQVYHKNGNKSVYYGISDSQLSWLINAPYKGKLVFCLANNHILDFGFEGYLSTVDFLEEHKIKYAPIDHSKLHELNGVKLRIFSYYNGINNSFQKALRAGNTDAYDDEIAIVCPHWGDEHVIVPSYKQLKFADLLFENGVDIIIGHHSPTPQAVMMKEEKIVAFSLGNLNIYQEDVRPQKINEMAYLLGVDLAKDKTLSYSQYPISISKDGFPSLTADHDIITSINLINGTLPISAFGSMIHSSWIFLYSNIVGGWIPRLKKDFLRELFNMLRWFCSRKVISYVVVLPLFPFNKSTKLLKNINRND